MGVLKAEFTRGKEIFSFSYSGNWLKSCYSQILDPELQLYTGSQYAKEEKQNFGVFLDSSPDRWGRILMKRREAAMARSEKRPEKTLRESDYLFVSNTDDHLRNHGFILTEKGWILSPAFDINPNEDGSGLSLNISLDDNSLDLDLTLEVAGYFRLTNENALKIIENIKKSVINWRSVANKYQLPKSEQELMAKVFERFL